MNRSIKFYNILLGVYFLNIILTLLSCVPMLLHVAPLSKCLIFAYKSGGDLNYGNYLICTLIGYGNVIIILGNLIILYVTFNERRKVPKDSITMHPLSKKFVVFHMGICLLTFALVLIFTSGYSVGCSNLSEVVTGEMRELMVKNPQETRGEDIRTLFEDNYKFHRYTERYGNRYGLEYFQPKVTCRTLYSDPEIHQRMHDSHVKKYANHFGYFYQTDIQAYTNDAFYTNTLVETSLVGSWLTFLGWLLSGVFIFWARKSAKRELLGAFQGNGKCFSSNESTTTQDFIRKGSTHSLYSGKYSSSKREIDDVALSQYSSKGHVSHDTLDRQRTNHQRRDFGDPRLSRKSFGTDVETEIF